MPGLWLVVYSTVLVGKADRLSICMEALGPMFACLLLNSYLSPCTMAFFGDSQHVVDLLACTQRHMDLFVFMRIELARNLLADWVYFAA